MKAMIVLIGLMFLSCTEQHELPQVSSQIYAKYVTNVEPRTLYTGGYKWHGFYFSHPFVLPPRPIPYAMIYTFPLDGTMASVAISFWHGADATYYQTYIDIDYTDSVSVECSPPFAIEMIYSDCDSIRYEGNKAMIFFNGSGSIYGIFLKNINQ